MHKHAKIYQWFTFWPVFACYYVPKILVLSAMRKDFRSCWAVFQGIAAFWWMLLNPDLSVLPAALKATTKPIAPRGAAWKNPSRRRNEGTWMFRFLFLTSELTNDPIR